MSNEKIIDKIRSLLKKTTENGATEAEATLALNKAYKLMAQYHIDQTEALNEKPVYTKKVVTYTTTYGNLNWVANLLRIIAENNQVFRVLGHKKGMFILFGTPDNIEMTQRFFDYAYDVAITFGKIKFKHQKLDRYKFWTSYGHGFADGVAEQFDVISDEVGSTAIILNNLVTVKAAYPTPLKSITVRSNRVFSNNYNSGVADGRNLRKAIVGAVSSNAPKQIGMK